MNTEHIRVSGRVVDRRTGAGQPDMRVDAWDKEHAQKNRMGSAVTDSQGRFQIEIPKKQLEEVVQGPPELYFRIYQAGEMVASTEDLVLWNVSRGESELRIEVDTLSFDLDELALERCAPGVRSLLQQSEQVIRQSKERDLRRLAGTDALRPGTKPRISLLPLPSAREGRVLPHPVYGAVLLEPHHEVRVRALVDFAGNVDDLRSMGIKVRSAIQNVFTITATRAQIAELAGHAATRKIRLPHAMLPSLEDAVATAEIDHFHDLNNEGAGVIVGIADGALDVRQYAFRQPGTDTTRVKFLWVQEPDVGASGPSPETYFAPEYPPGDNPFAGLDYGILYDEDAINAALDSYAMGAGAYGTGAGQIADTPSFEGSTIEISWRHGTHVAGIAAGSGYRGPSMSDVPQVGAAPRADIVHVHVRWRSAAYEDDILDAYRFIVEIGERLSQPVVSVCCMGSNLGPHNGQSLTDVARDALLDSSTGRSIVVPSCNYNFSQGFHAGTLDDEDDVQVLQLAPADDQDIWLDVWNRGPALSYQLERADTPGASTGWQTPGSGVSLEDTLDGYEIRVERDSETGGEGLHNIRVYVQDATLGALWLLRLRNDEPTRPAPYWAWVGIRGTDANLLHFTTDEMTIGDSACARAPLAVGATMESTPFSLEAFRVSSGCGPTLDGRVKPEIVAVGTNMVAAAAGSTSENLTMSGTSQAAALAAGAVALLLEQHPGLNQDTIKGLLTENAESFDLHNDPRSDLFEPIDRNRFGYGRLRMVDHFDRVLAPDSVDVFIRTAEDDFGATPYLGDAYHRAPEVFVQAGAHFDPDVEPTSNLSWGHTHAVRVRVHNLGDLPASGTTVQLFYTRPWTAPVDWTPCRNGDGDELVLEGIEIPALRHIDVIFDASAEVGDRSWVPQVGEVPEVSGRDWGDHYCLLAVASHPDDETEYYDYAGEHDDEGVASNVWGRNIKDDNNVALLNLSIQ